MDKTTIKANKKDLKGLEKLRSKKEGSITVLQRQFHDSLKQRKHD